MPYNSGTGAYERRTTTVIDATPDGDTVAVAIDVKLDTAADDAVLDLNHHKANGSHYPAASVEADSRFLGQTPAGVVEWKNGVPAPDAALKDMSNVANGAIAPAKIAQDTDNRFVTDAEKTTWNGKSDSAHTHNYAGSASAGGPASTALACTGNAATATKLATAITISLTGAVSGSASFDGSAAVSIAAVVANDSHTHSTYAATSHTHSGYLDTDIGYNDVGSLCLCQNNNNTSTALAVGGTIAGSLLVPYGFWLSGISQGTYETAGSALTGTWRCLGKAPSTNSSPAPKYVTLFQRIS